jgi:glycogen(starch) synthase
MKVLLLNNIFPPGFIGGYELGAYDIATGLIDRGHDVQVLTSDYLLDDHGLCEVSKVTRTLTWATLTHELIQPGQFESIYYNHRNLRELGRAIRAFRPDMVLALNLMGLGAVSIIKYLQALKMPLVLYLMDNIFFGIENRSELHLQYEKLFGAFRFDERTRIIAMSKNVIAEVGVALGVGIPNITYVPGWVDVTSDLKGPERRTNGRTRFVFCSRVAPHKGVDLMLESVERLVLNGLDNFYLDVYGPGQVASFMQRVKAKGLDRHIFYKGVADKKDLPQILSHYDALIFPTWEREAFGFVASEAAVAGCIPILTAGIGASEWFLDGVDSLKISRNAVSLYGAMSQVLHWTEDELMSLRSAALRSARKNFDFGRWLQIIERLCSDAASLGSPLSLGAQSKAAESAFLYLSTLLRGVLH